MRLRELACWVEPEMRDLLVLIGVVILLACYASVACRTRVIALSLLILMAPWRSILSHLGGEPFVIGSARVGVVAIVLDGMLVILLTSWVSLHLISGRPFYLAVRMMPIYVAIMAMFVFASPSLMGGMIGFRNTALVVTAAIIAADEVKEERDLIVLAVALIGGALPFAVLGIAQFYLGGRLPGWLQYESGVPATALAGVMGYFRANGTIGNPLVYGHFVALPVLMVYPLLAVTRAKLAFYTFVGLAIGIVAVGVSLSRSSWYGLLPGLVATTILNWRNGAWRGAVSLIGATALLLFAVTPEMRGAFADRFLSADAGSQQTAMTRLETAQLAASGLSRKHILGVGLGRYGGGYGRFVPLSEEESIKANGVLVTDNYYLKLLIETGIAGLTAFTLLLAETLVRLYRSARFCQREIPRALAIGSIGCAVATVFTGLFSNSLDSRIVGLYFWLAVGIGLGAEKVEATEQSEMNDPITRNLISFRWWPSR